MTHAPAPDFLPFALPDIGEEDIAEVVDALRSGWVTTGPRARRFEADFAQFLGDPELHCLAVNSATAGLHLALEALGIGPGDEVITTTHTFTATAEVVRYLGADVVLVDVDPQTLNLDVAAVEAALTPRTKAILPVHFAGLAAPMAPLLALARQHGLRVVEDAAHALPTTSGGQLVGTLGSDLTVFSFYANKTITTGEGGMVVTRDAELARRIRVMRLHGINRDAFDRFTAKVPSWYYEIVAPGFKYNLTDLAAALGLHQLRKAYRFAAARAEVAAIYHEGLRDLPVSLPAGDVHAASRVYAALGGVGSALRPDDAPADGAQAAATSSGPTPELPSGRRDWAQALQPGDELHPWHLYVLRLWPQAPLGRDALIEALFRDGIGCSVHYVPLHQQPYWRERYGLQPAQFPHSQTQYEHMLSLPIYSAMRPCDAHRVVAAIRRHLGAAPL